MNTLPLRTSALEMLGVSTISSIGFPVGSICRDKRLYDSGCVSLERFEGKCLGTHLVGFICLQRKEQNLAVGTTNVDLRA